MPSCNPCCHRQAAEAESCAPGTVLEHVPDACCSASRRQSMQESHSVLLQSLWSRRVGGAERLDVFQSRSISSDLKQIVDSTSLEGDFHRLVKIVESTQSSQSTAIFANSKKIFDSTAIFVNSQKSTTRQRRSTSARARRAVMTYCSTAPMTAACRPGGT